MLACGQRGELLPGLLVARGGVAVAGDERDQAAGDGGRQRALAGVDGLDRADDVGWRGILEQEPGGSRRLG